MRPADTSSDVVRYVLRHPDPTPVAPPQLDPSQQAVVDHGRQPGAGPLLVLAGPGTGKTTTLVELVVDRVVGSALAADDVLVLTFSRKAAQDLRARIARRLPGTVVPTMTFHGYCYALVRSASPPEAFGDPLRLLSAAEQELRLAEIVRGSTELGRITWPADLTPALRTRGFARELADFIARARSHGLDPGELHALADARDEPGWHAVADLWREYDEVLSLAREADYAGLVDEALTVVEPRHQPRLIVVDEYQDTDPAQVALLRRLVGPSTELVAVGDPDQSIYAFRGADVGGVWRFPDLFGSPDRPATTLALRQTRRFGPDLLAASRAVIRRIGLSGSLSVEEFTAFRNPLPADDLPGRLDVRLYTDARAEAEHIARTLRRAHLRDGVPLAQMAVLVRSGRETISRYERALREAGLAVEVAGDEIPLAGQPAIRALLLAAGVALGLAGGGGIALEEAEALLTGPLGHLDPAGLRTLARALRHADAEQTGTLRDSRDVVADALANPTVLADLPGRAGVAAERASRLAATLRRAARQVADGEPAEQVLWTLWDGTAWPRRLAAAADAGDDAAHRDLDALVALFDDAARAEERGSHTGLRAYLDALQAQQIPSDPLSDHGTRGQAVRVMTAHRAKGLEWDLVVVAGVQDGRWPVVRPTATLLRAERLDPAGGGHPPTLAAVVAEERRLFYVALTRARRRLVVTAVESLASDGEQPSRFLEELKPFATQPDEAPRRRPRRPMSLRGAVTQLRWMAESAPQEAVREGAAQRLADLGGLVPAADPARWWGLAPWTSADQPIRPADRPLDLSGSAVDALSECALRWFLQREARGEQPTSTAQGFGLAVHVLAAEVVEQTQVDADALIAHLDAVWHRLDYETPWIAEREHAEAEAAVRRFVHWHLDHGDRRPAGSEVEFVVEVPVGDDVVRLRGSMDRVEVDADGRVHVVDFKTGKSTPTKEEVARHAQLGIYQVAVAHGGVAAGDVSGGAELVQLRHEYASQPGWPKVQSQPPPDPDEPFFADELLRQSAESLRAERFPATTNRHCPNCEFRRICPAQIGPTVEDAR